MLTYELDLHLFDGDGAGTGTGAGEGGTADNAGSSHQQTGGTVIYGKPDPDAGDQSDNDTNTEPNTETNTENDQTAQERKPEIKDKKAAFRELIDGEYKQEFTDYFQETFDRRHKDAKANEEKLSAISPLLDTLGARYGLDGDNVEALQKALDADLSFWENAAAEKGVTVDQYKQMVLLERENAQLKAVQARYEEQRAESERERQAREQVTRWHAEAEELKKEFPEFDLQTEAQNESFVGMLQAGVPMANAYRVAHWQEIESGIVSRAAKNAEQQVVAAIRSGQSRPTENAGNATNAVVVKSDPSKWTDADWKEVKKRVRRGEKIFL